MLNEQLNEDDFQDQIIHLTFSYGKKKFCAPVDTIKEIVDLPVIIPTPVNLEHTLGIFNLRGTVIPVFDPFDFFMKELETRGPLFFQYLQKLKTRLLIFEIRAGVFSSIPVTEVNKVELNQNDIGNDHFIEINSVPYEYFDVNKIWEKK